MATSLSDRSGRVASMELAARQAVSANPLFATTAAGGGGHAVAALATEPRSAERYALLEALGGVSEVLRGLLRGDGLEVALTASGGGAAGMLQSVASAHLQPSAKSPFLLWWGLAFAAVDATLGQLLSRCVWRAKSVSILDRTAYITKSASGWPTFWFAQSYAESPGFGPRAHAFRSMLLRVMVYATGLTIMLALAWPLLLVPGARDAHAYALVRWFVDAIRVLFNAAAAGDRMGAGLMLTIINTLLLWGVILMLLAGKQRFAAALGASDTSLPSVLSLITRPCVPFAMVSYTWANEEAVATARSLSELAPGMWIDVRGLSSGTNVPVRTAAVAASCYVLVIILTPQYMSRAACMIELAAALLHRRLSEQVTLVLCPEPVCRQAECAQVLPLLQSAGAIVFHDGVSLVQHLSSHAYCAEQHSDALRFVSFLRRFGAPEVDIQRHLRMPSPVVRKRQPCCAASWTGCLRRPPPNSIWQGSRFIDAAGDSSGWACVVTSEQWLVAALVAHVAAAVLLLVLNCVFPADATTPDTRVCQPFVLAGACMVLAIVVIPAVRILASLSVDLDARNWHDPLLMPLNTAAFAAAAVQQHQRLSVPPSDLRASVSAGIHFHVVLPHWQTGDVEMGILARRLRCLTRFLHEDVGINADCTVLNPRRSESGSVESLLLPHMAALDDGQGVHLYAVVLATRIDAADFLDHVVGVVDERKLLLLARDTVLSTTSTTTSHRSGRAVALSANMCIVLGSSNGVSKSSPYVGLVPAIIDSLGAKLGPATAAGSVATAGPPTTAAGSHR